MVKRAKTGCISCRIRRVKCDETKPQCLRCQSARRKCDGYLPEDRKMSRRQMMDALSKISAIGPASDLLAAHHSLPSPVSSPPFIVAASSPSSTSSSSLDLTYFDYFRRATAPNTDSFIPSMFWGQDLLQLAHAEPAIWHATLAVGALHRRWEIQSTGAEMNALVRDATVHYVKAMALAKDLNSPTKLLALGLPLIASANMLGFWSESHTHILSGFRILAQNPDSYDAQRIAATLTRMDMQSFSFCDTAAPYPWVEAATTHGGERELDEDAAVVHSYSQAATKLFSMIRRLVLNNQSFWEGGIDASTHDSVNQELLRNMLQFERLMTKFEARQRDYLDEHAAISVRIYHTWLRLIYKTGCFGLETLFDDSLGYLQHITTLVDIFIKRRGKSDSLQLSLEPAVVLPLFDVGKRCRHPALRRHALKLMKEMNRHEGMWRSDGAAATIETIMEVEEEGLEDMCENIWSRCPNYCITERAQKEALAIPWSAWSSKDFMPPTNYSWEGVCRIPEKRRVSSVMVAIQFQTRELDIRLLTSALDPEDPDGSVRKFSLQF